MNPQEKTISRIKKALALQSSDNPHEAAAGLRQAQALMAKHNLTLSDIQAAEIGYTTTPANVKKSPTEYETTLAVICAKAFACDLLFAYGFGKSHRGRWLFVGCETSHQLAAYSFSVLWRQLKKARQEHIASLSKRCKPATKTARADKFCEGWVVAVIDKVTVMAQSQHVTDGVAAYKEKHLSKRSDFEPRPSKNTPNTHSSATMGYLSGEKASLHRPMTDTSQPVTLLN